MAVRSRKSSVRLGGMRGEECQCMLILLLLLVMLLQLLLVLGLPVIVCEESLVCGGGKRIRRRVAVRGAWGSEKRSLGSLSVLSPDLSLLLGCTRVIVPGGGKFVRDRGVPACREGSRFVNGIGGVVRGSRSWDGGRSWHVRYIAVLRCELLLLGGLMVTRVAQIVLAIHAVFVTFHHLIGNSLVLTNLYFVFKVQESNKVHGPGRLLLGGTAKSGSESEFVELVAEQIGLSLEIAELPAGGGPGPALGVDQCNGRVDDSRFGGAANRSKVWQKGGEVQEAAVEGLPAGTFHGIVGSPAFCSVGAAAGLASGVGVDWQGILLVGRKRGLRLRVRRFAAGGRGVGKSMDRHCDNARVMQESFDKGYAGARGGWVRLQGKNATGSRFLSGDPGIREG
jgi:hypothetical protein